jgi:hypothetical protein
MILFFGAEFTKVYARAHGHKLEPSEYAVPLTEEARIQQGIPHEQTVWNAVAEDNVSRAPGPAKPATAAPSGRPLLAAGAGMALGALGAWSLANSTRNRVLREVTARRVAGRIAELERRAGRASTLREDLARVGLAERIQRIERCIKHVARNAPQTHRAPANWADRLASLLR